MAEMMEEEEGKVYQEEKEEMGKMYQEEEEEEDLYQDIDQTINWDLDTLDFNFASGKKFNNLTVELNYLKVYENLLFKQLLISFFNFRHIVHFFINLNTCPKKVTK